MRKVIAYGFSAIGVALLYRAWISDQQTSYIALFVLGAMSAFSIASFAANSKGKL
jgi:hypothetical protein